MKTEITLDKIQTKKSSTVSYVIREKGKHWYIHMETSKSLPEGIDIDQICAYIRKKAKDGV